MMVPDWYMYIFAGQGRTQDNFCLGGGGGGGRGVVDLITLPYLLYVFRQTGLSKQCKSRLDATERDV